MAIKVSDKRQRKRTKGRQTLSNYFPMSFKGWIVYVLSMLTACAMSTLMRNAPSTDVYVPLIFVLAVLITAIMTEGYFYGILASVTSVVAVNWAFTYPYMKINFSIYGYPLTFLTMLAVGCAVSTLTSRLKEQEKIKTESEREKTRANLLRAISHDLRTPPTSISGSIGVVLDDDGSLTGEQKRELLAGAKTDAEWLCRMVENLLSITRMSGEQARIEKECEAAEEIVAVSVSKFSRRFPEIHVSVEVPDEVLLVPMDATLIRQVIMNLLENAAIHGRGVTEISFRVSREGDCACFSISDNGVGIPSEKLPTIFSGGLSGVSHNNFDMKKNMGIGLSVCSTIVKAHGGTMTAENLESGGACFRFYLPMEEGLNSEIEG